MNTTVVNVRTDAFDIYIGRRAPKARDPRCRFDSIWGNPFRIGPDGDRDEVIRKYRIYLFSNPELLRQARTILKGKRLGCWCFPLPCHGDVLISVVDGSLGEG